jgi:hypothetical protein
MGTICLRCGKFREKSSSVTVNKSREEQAKEWYEKHVNNELWAEHRWTGIKPIVKPGPWDVKPKPPPSPPKPIPPEGRLVTEGGKVK